MIPVICWKTKNTHTTTSTRRTAGVHRVVFARRRTRPCTESASAWTCSAVTSMSSLRIATRTSSSRPRSSSQRGDSGISARSSSETIAGMKPTPSMSRQSTVVAASGKALSRITATT